MFQRRGGHELGLLEASLEVSQGLLLGPGLAQVAAGGAAEEVVGLEQGAEGQACGGTSEGALRR